MNKKTELVKKRYVSVSYRDVKGIRQDVKSQTFIVEKRIRGERFSATFDNIREAADWKKNFHPAANFKPLGSSFKKNISKSLSELSALRKRQALDMTKNGKDLGYLFGDVWKIYLGIQNSHMEYGSYQRLVYRGQYFFKGLMGAEMVALTSDFLSDYLVLEKEKSVNSSKSHRYNFDDDLKALKTFLNWYRENMDSMFVNPVLKRHKLEGVIRKIPKRKKKLRRHELVAFFNALGAEGSFWRDLAEVQFYLSGRVQEVAGLQWSSVDFIDGIIDIENVAVWDSGKRFCQLKGCTKNGEERKVPMTERLFVILQERLKCRRPSTFKDVVRETMVPGDFVFHLDGKPLKYRTIQHHYNVALKRAGLGDKYSSTHILRHSMANMVRERMGIEHAQAVGGWKSRHLVEHVYTERPAHLTRDALENIEDFMKTIDESSAKRCQRLEASTSDKRRANDVQIQNTS